MYKKIKFIFIIGLLISCFQSKSMEQATQSQEIFTNQRSFIKQYLENSIMNPEIQTT
jgi:hypothetical protein